MAHHGILRDYRFSDDVDDIRGATLYGTDDEKLGKVDDVIFDHSSGTIQYAVIEAGGWFSSKKFVVPAERIRPYGENSNDFAIDMTKQQIESLPLYDEERFGKGKDWNQEHWNEYDKQYRGAYSQSRDSNVTGVADDRDKDTQRRDSMETTGDVLHREGSTHIITPTPDELPATGEALADEDAYTPDRVAGKFPETGPNAGKVRLRPGGLAARAEDTAAPGAFQGSDIPTSLEENELDEGVDVNSRRSPVGTQSASSISPGNTSWDTTQRDRLNRTGDVDVDDRVRQGRWGAYEDHLRRNRVDITASCRSCDVKKDRVA
jgi:sporulation protein YlmC with PRC-barrel domain